MPQDATSDSDEYTALQETIDQLNEGGSIYAFQVVYGPTSVDSRGDKVIRPKIFAARDTYAWPSDSPPGFGKRLGTFPFLGHWPGGNYHYRICENTFTEVADNSNWPNVVDHAFTQWELAVPDLLDVVSSRQDCSDNENGPVVTNDSLDKKPLVTAMENGSNEVFMVQPSLWLSANAIAYNPLFLCVLHSPACVISPRYKNVLARASLALDPGSVDVLINAETLNHHFSKVGPIPVPVTNGTRYGACLDINSEPADDGPTVYYPYALMVHEAGHALGLSQFSFTNPIGQRIAHPSVTGSVVNYDDKTGYEEYDCAPHPLDVMAIRALYQTLVP